jgi:hypothetical protein
MQLKKVIIAPRIDAITSLDVIDRPSIQGASIFNNMQLIRLSQGQFARVDDDLYDLLNQYHWYVQKCKNGSFYARNNKLGMLHRFIMNPPNNQRVDHIDHDGLNCQRYNMRNCNHIFNTRNRSKHKNNRAKYKGVCLFKDRHGIYRYIKAFINVDHKRIYLGAFKTQESAAIAYNKAAIKYHNEYASLNIIL